MLLTTQMEPGRSAHTVSVETDGGVLLLTATFDFLRDSAPARVHKLLVSWNFGAVVRDAGSAKRVIVAREGWKLASR